MNEITRLIVRASWPFKLGVLCLVVVLILHIVGLSTNRWSTANSSAIKSNLTFGHEIMYKGGLWSHCACSKLFGFETCRCMDKRIKRAWFVATQTTVILALVSLVVTCVLSLAAIFSTQQVKIKIANVIMTFCSGFLIAVAVFIYGMEANAHIDQTFMSLPYLSTAKFDYSFICCCIASGLCLLVVVPLFVFDARRVMKRTAMDTATVQYTTQE